VGRAEIAPPEFYRWNSATSFAEQVIVVRSGFLRLTGEVSSATVAEIDPPNY
jgi:hypothetical protein